MELPKYDIPESIFFELFVEYFLFSFPHPEPFTVFFDEFFSYLFAYPVTDIVPEHSSNNGDEYRHEEMITRPESSDEDHHVHPGNCRPDDGKWLDTCRGKCYEIIPFTEWLYQLSYPLDSSDYPILPDEWYDEYGKSRYRQKESNCLREKYEELFDMTHASMIWKSEIRAREKEKRIIRKYLSFSYNLEVLFHQRPPKIINSYFNYTICRNV